MDNKKSDKELCRQVGIFFGIRAACPSIKILNRSRCFQNC